LRPDTAEYRGRTGEEWSKILGTSTQSIAFAEDRELFRQKMIELGIRQTDGGTAFSLDEAVE